ncbi:sulfite exporter TauE/SafE family protein [Wansuia hejianensis]
MIKEFKMNEVNLNLIIIGAIAGFVNGLFGSGGGTIIVPALIFLMDLEDHKAHATAISIILPLSIISTIVYFLNNKVSLKLSSTVMIGGVVGSYIGAKLLNKIPTQVLRKIFGSVIIYTAIRMILK